MKSPILIDTSVMVAATLKEHRHHQASFALIKKVMDGKIKGYLCSHSLAEAFAVLTAMPIQPRISSELALELMQNNFAKNFSIIELKKADYFAAMARVCKTALKGGILYDALIVQAALRMQIPSLYTWNIQHFGHLSFEEVSILQPSE
ncbi:MAG: PIN domain-containing protein [Deltaproteobacteria bacterium]|nr:PIN domain-containing protein [Deltaproteobacteria bacterium]